MSQNNLNSLIQVRVDTETKRKVDELSASLGFDTPTAVRMFFQQMLDCRGLPFRVAKKKPSFMFDTQEELIEKLNEGLLSEDAGTAEEMFAEMRRKYDFERV